MNDSKQKFRLPAPEAKTVEVATPQPIAVRIREACRISGIGRSKLYELIGAGEISVVKVGRITLIPVSSLRHFIESRTR